MRGFSLGLVVLSLSLGCGEQGEKPYLTRFDRTMHISHQGGAEVFPSNTMLAYEYAVVDYDTDVLEIDVHRTKDGVLVVLHDETVDRTTDGTGYVKEMTIEAVKALDAGYRFTTDDGQTFPYRGRGLTIPTLAEIFQAFPDMLTNIEVKQVSPHIESDLLRMIRDFHMQEKVCLGSFMEESAKILRQEMPEACHYISEDMATEFYIMHRVGLGGLHQLPIDAVSFPFSFEKWGMDLTVLDEGMLNTMHDRGKAVWAWTINDKEDMKKLLDWGVDGIMTDRPDLLDEVMTEQGVR